MSDNYSRIFIIIHPSRSGTYSNRQSFSINHQIRIFKMISIRSLPHELLIIIIDFLCKDSIRSLSLVNKELRYLCNPYLFQTLKIHFSLTGLYRINQVSQSQIACYTRTIQFFVHELIDPGKSLSTTNCILLS